MMAEHITLDALMQSSGHTALQVQEPASMETVRAQVEELSPEQKARVEEVKNSIDLMDSQAALQYGVGAQRNISSFSYRCINFLTAREAFFRNGNLSQKPSSSPSTSTSLTFSTRSDISSPT